MALSRATARSRGCASTSAAAFSSPGSSSTSAARSNGNAKSTAEEVFKRFRVEPLDNVGGMFLSERRANAAGSSVAAVVEGIVHGSPLLDRRQVRSRVSRFAWDQTTPCADGSDNRLWLSLGIEWDACDSGLQAGRWLTQKAASTHLARMRHCRARCLSASDTTKFQKSFSAPIWRASGEDELASRRSAFCPTPRMASGGCARWQMTESF